MGPRALPVLLLLVAGCAAPGPAPAPAAPGDPAPPAAPWDGGWYPPEDLLAEARLLGSGDPAARAAAEARLAAVSDADRVHLLRAGVRLPDGPAAVACAKRLKWRWLDDAESGRCVRLLTPHLGEPDTDDWFEEYRSYLGSEELHEVFAKIPELVERNPDAVDWSSILSNFHRMTRAEHLPVLTRLAVHTHDGVRRGAWDCIQTTIPNTDRYREEVARAWLGGDEVKEGKVVQRPGYPPLLREVLSSLYSDGSRSEVVEAWAARWMAEEAPTAEDLHILLGMLADPGLSVVPTAAALRALGHLEEPAATRALAAFAGGPGSVREGRVLALASLHRLGLERVLEGLREISEELGPDFDTAPLALALLAEADPEGTDLSYETRLVPPPSNIDRLLDRIGRMRNEASRFGIAVPDEFLDGFEEEVIPYGLDGVSLARIAATIPGCRTRRMAESAIETLRWTPPEDPEEASGPAEGGDRDEARLPRRDEEAAFLEVAAPDAFRTLLREWARLKAGSYSSTREWALGSLLLLGDPESGPLLVSWLKAKRVEDPGGSIATLRFVDWTTATALLARSPCPEVREYLLQLERDPEPVSEYQAGLALGGLAELGGLPERTADVVVRGVHFESERLSDSEARKTVRRLILEGEPVDALAVFLSSRPDAIAEDLGLVGDERVRGHLRRLRERRELGLYREATEQLAIGGDARCREEVRRAWATGRYRWVDSADGMAYAGGKDPSAMSFWIGELEAACCRNNVPSWLLDLYFDRDPRSLDAGLVGRTERTRRWWEEYGPRMRWSRLAERFVIGPEE